jgi:hypothetical protein
MERERERETACVRSVSNIGVISESLDIFFIFLRNCFFHYLPYLPGFLLLSLLVSADWGYFCNVNLEEEEEQFPTAAGQYYKNTL